MPAVSGKVERRLKLGGASNNGWRDCDKVFVPILIDGSSELHDPVLPCAWCEGNKGASIHGDSLIRAGDSSDSGKH